MAVTIIAIAGSSQANSYCTLAEAELYIETSLYTTDWDYAESYKKNQALVMATRLLDEHIDWKGQQKDDEQSLRWPRSNVYTQDHIEVDDETIPQFLINATAELAKYLLKEDRTAESELSQFKRMKADVLELEIDSSGTPLVLPESVQAIVLNYGTLNYGGGMIKIERA